jgi:serine/threonine protein kinase
VNGQWKVADFGISRILEETTSTNTNANNLSISYRYMPPEAVEGLISPHWDVWSLGILITLLITGEHPFPHSNTMQLSWKICQENPVFARPIEPLYKKIITGCLAKQRYKRWKAKKLLSYFSIARSSDNTKQEIDSFLQERLEDIEVLRQYDDYKEIISICEIIIDLQPNHSEAWYIKGEAHCCLEDYQQALDNYNQAIHCNPNYTMAIHARDYITKKLQSQLI